MNTGNKPGLITGAVISNNTPAPNPLSAPTMLPVNSNYPPPAHPMVGSHPHKQILTNPNNQVTVNQTCANQATPGKVIVQNGDISPELQNGVQESAEEKENILNTEESLANTKEKTPMCLINELARYNKVSTCTVKPVSFLINELASYNKVGNGRNNKITQQNLKLKLKCLRPLHFYIVR